MVIPSELKILCQRLHDAGGRPLIVGGCIRDHILGRQVKDWDIEVFRLEADRVAEIASLQGKVNEVGKSFGVMKLATADGEDFDIALPRREKKTGEGHQGFEVVPDPDMLLSEAVLRRDFTINALCYDPITDDIIDLVGGAKDLSHGILRPVSDRFKEDPLRVLRGMQFAGRFDLKASPDFIRMAKEIHGSFDELPGERVYAEFAKWASKSVKPSQGLKLLEQTGWITHFPEIDKLRACPQSPEWHPEGDVFKHSLHCCDALAEKPEFREKKEEDRTSLMLTMLAHDFGKPEKSRFFRKADGSIKITAHGHEAAGVEPFRNFLSRMKAPSRDFAIGGPIIKEHLIHAQFVNEPPSDKAVLRLSKRMGKASILDLCLIMQSDLDGRPPLPKGRGPGIANILETSRKLEVESSPPKPLIQGRDLIERGYKSGVGMGKILNSLMEKQLDGEFSNREEALKSIPVDSPSPSCEMDL